MIIKSFAPPYFKHFSLSLNREKHVVMRVMGKKPNIFTLQLPIYYILKKEILIGANVRSSRPDVFCKKVFLKISPNAQEKTCAQSLFYNEVAGLEHATLFKKRPWHRCFPVNFVKFLRTRFFKERLR